MRGLKHAACSIAFIQETHLTRSTSVNVGVSFQLNEMLADDCGRFLFLKGYIGNTQWTLANVYCPNYNQPTFMSHILTKLTDFV